MDARSSIADARYFRLATVRWNDWGNCSSTPARRFAFRNGSMPLMNSPATARLALCVVSWLALTQNWNPPGVRRTIDAIACGEGKR